MKKEMITGAIAMSIVSMGLLSACGNSADTQPSQEEIVNATETEEAATEEVAEETAGEASVGLQEYEGFYCTTTTEQIEDYEVTTTNGYLFNGDGTGVSYGQDVVDFTWNETEIHFGESTENFTMEAGKLKIGDVEFDKIDGNLILPQPCNVDIENVDNGIYHAGIDLSGISETDGKVTVSAEIYTEETYDIVDVNRMTKGDVIYINGELLPVEIVEKTDSGALNINGGIEEMGSALRPEEESNCYVYFGMDDYGSYTCHGVAELTLSENAKLINNADPSEVKETTGSDVGPALKELLENYSLSCYNCIITVEEGEIVEINRVYVP